MHDQVILPLIDITGYRHPHSFTMKLFRADVKNKTQMVALKKSIESTTNIADKAWVLEKFTELSG